MGLAVRAFQTELWRGFESRLSRSGENNDLLGLYRTAALRTEFPDVRDALTVFDGSAPRFEPGTAFEYFSLGTVLLGASMGQASRLSFRDVMQEQVFQPL
ncbi:MAG: serine hydrolase, partial [Pseudomonadota bacterium]